MAELPRYKRAALLTATPPQTQLSGMQEAARGSESLSASMDRLSRFAFGIAEQQAEIAGIEYGAANAPTVEQLDRAVKSGKDVKDMIPGDTMTVFGSNARSAAMDLVSARMESAARESITAVQAAFENNRIDLSTMQSKFATIEDSYSQVLMDISPTAAAQFRAKIGVVGNSAFLSAAKSQAKKDRADLEIQLRADADRSISQIETVLRAGVTVNEQSGEIITPEMRVEVLRDDIIRAAQLIDDPEFAQTKLNAFQKQLTDAKIGIVMEDVIGSPDAGISLLSGKAAFDDPDVAAVYQGMNPEERRALFKTINDQVKSDLALESQIDSQNDRRRDEVSDALIPQIIYAETMGDRSTASQLLGQLAEVDPDKYASYAPAFYASGGTNVPEVIDSLLVLELNGQLTYSSVNEARSNGFLDQNTYASFLGKLDAQRNEDHKNAMQVAKSELGYPDKGILNPSADQQKAMRAISEIETALVLEARKNPELDRLSFVRSQIEQKRALLDRGISAGEAAKKVNGLAASFGMPEGSSPEAVKRELDKRVANGSYNPNGASAYDQAFKALGAM